MRPRWGWTRCRMGACQQQRCNKRVAPPPPSSPSSSSSSSLFALVLVMWVDVGVGVGAGEVVKYNNKVCVERIGDCVGGLSQQTLVPSVWGAICC